MDKVSTLTSTNVAYEMRKLRLRTRNQVRAILESDGSKSINLINLLRKKKTAKEIVQIERVLRTQAKKRGNTIPDIFPQKIQTKENYHRLSPLNLQKQLDIIEILVTENEPRLTQLKRDSISIGLNILDGDLTSASEALDDAIKKSGYSHFLLRKAALIRTLNVSNLPLAIIDRIFDEAGLGSNNVIVSSLLHCYQEEQDILGIKRSIMNLPNRGSTNKFTRDITRTSLHPHAKNEEDLSEILQSNLQSSLIDALIILKVNRHHLNTSKHKAILNYFDKWDLDGIPLENIAYNYLSLDDGETVFYKHSSAWLENKEIIEYRTLQDHFYDDPEATYFELTDELAKRISGWVGDINLEDLVSKENLTNHSLKSLRALEEKGFITRSSIFNFLIHQCEGFTKIPEDKLFNLMGRTRDLSKTVNTKHLRNLAKGSSSPISKIIFYLLISRKSRNEGDNHQLRRLLQQVVKSSHDGELIKFVVALSEKSRAVAEYTYDVCTEDFIAKLPHIITSSAQITETRASLHKWMGDQTGEKSYLDRARNLLIDHQINRVRNEIDDNRIYVDVTRFSEWINDELMRELNTVLTSMEHNQTLVNAEDPQLLSIIGYCYSTFCSNNIFGIASYLGRRIRHGTFKGHLYSSVISIETATKYKPLFSDPIFSAKWEHWKSHYESTIDNIIRSRLHIESSAKPDGLLRPNLRGIGKLEIALACAKTLTKEFIDNKTTATSVQILTEYCWRIAEVDLKNVNAFLKGQKANLMMNDLLTELKLSQNTNRTNQELSREFSRELVRIINEKLMAMYGWFKRPLSASPKASLSLLYKAVVAEVKETFSAFDVDTDFEEDKDIEIVGGPYHVLYDAFYVVVYNAAKHGKQGGKVERTFSIIPSINGRHGVVAVTINSEVRDNECEDHINERLKIKPGDDIDNAQLSEDRSGIRKLHQLQKSDRNFLIDEITCKNKKVSVSMSYALEHL